MSARSSVQESFKPDTNGKKTAKPHEQKPGKKFDGSRTMFAGTCRFKLPKTSEISPVKYLKHLGDKVVAVLRFVSTRRRASTKVSSSSTPKPCTAPIDSQRAEAIDDCIEFINSSSSLQRSNSVSC